MNVRMTKLSWVLALALCVPVVGLAAEEEMSDTWLQAKLVTTYVLNRNLSTFDIDADVRDQVAYLTGRVQSDAEKDLAEEIAKSIEGIKSVDNKITVDRSIARRDRTNEKDRSFGQMVEDLTTTASIKSKLLANTNVSGLDINVDTFNSKVTLSGKVESDAQRQLAQQIAKNTDGVVDVKSNLQLDPSKS